MAAVSGPVELLEGEKTQQQKQEHTQYPPLPANCPAAKRVTADSNKGPEAQCIE